MKFVMKSMMNWSTLLLFGCWLVTSGADAFIKPSASKNPDVDASFEKLVLRHGDVFDFQTYHITTEDGYILPVYRIRSRKATTEARDRGETVKLKPVIVLHGLMHSAYTWIVNSPNLYNANNSTGDNLGYALALTNRYDVWIPSLRGNDPKQHLKLKPENDKFWKFTFEQIALMDIPAVVQYVRRETNRNEVALIGTSLGTTTTFMLLAMRPEYANWIRPFIATAPVLFIEHLTDPMFQALGTFGQLFCLNDGELAVTGPLVQKIIKWSCANSGPLCKSLFSSDNINKTQVPVMASHYPTSTSNRNGCHLFQWFNSKRLSRFDYGTPAKNRKHYNQPEPPLIELPNIAKNAQIALMSSEKDAVSTPQDVATIRTLLIDKIGIELVDDIVIGESLNWSHTDFIFGMGAGMVVNDPVIDILDRTTR